MNELHLSQSPYLLQHRKNPVHWKLWNDFNLEANKDRLIIISIGYSSCHWCHVMAHECFEDEEVAQLMNDHFVSFKIDREEQPDVDSIYMTALQLMTHQGGWPLNIVALPNGYPIWGCTYLPKNQWMHQLDQLQKLYRNDKERVEEYADQLHQHVHLSNQLDLILETDSFGSLDEMYQSWIRTFDYEWGGIDRAPKFIMPTHFDFLFQYHNPDSVDTYIFHSLQIIQNSGIHDLVEGGFYRYSVDHYWHIPHFEKMLYDQGQLISTYVQAFFKYDDPSFLETAQNIQQFVTENWQSPQGGYYGSYDADSSIDDQHTQEGYYYVLTPEDLQIWPEDHLPFICDYYGLNDNFLWEKRFFHIQQREKIDVLAQKHTISIEKAHFFVEHSKKILKNIRKKKAKPALDTKRITSWNALLLSGMIDLYFAQPTEILKSQLEALYHYLSKSCYQENGWLIHSDSLQNQKPLLEDYSTVIRAFFKYYQIHFDSKILWETKQLLDSCIDLFWDENQEFFASHLPTQQHIVTQFEIEDNVIPSANSMLCDSLMLASLLFDNAHYKKLAHNMLYKVTKHVDSLSVYSQWFSQWIKWEESFNYLMAKDYTAEELHTIKREQKDYHLYLISYDEKIPLCQSYATMSNKEIQRCNLHACFMKTTDMESFFKK